MGGEIEAYSRRSLAGLLNYSQSHSPFYRERFHQLGIDGPVTEERSLEVLGRLPILDKKDIRNNMPTLAVPGYSSLLRKRMNTGGSTGEPLEFPGSRKAGWVDQIHHEEVYRFLGYRFGDRIVAIDGTSIPEEARSRNEFWIRRTERQLPFGGVHFSAHYLTPETACHYLRGIREFRPAFIRGYPSALHEISLQALQTGVRFDFPVKGVILTSENVLEGQLEAIEQAFGCPVVLQYGLTEMCAFAHTPDASREYCFSPVYGHVEVLRPDGQPAGPGETGEIVATGYFGMAMPFIRYRTGDMAVFKQRAGGIVRVARILGRSQDVLLRRDGSRVFVTSVIFGQHFRSFGRIAQWQIEQHSPGEIVVAIVPMGGFTADDEEEIRLKFRNLAQIEVSFQYVEKINRTLSGKTLFVINHCVDAVPPGFSPCTP